MKVGAPLGRESPGLAEPQFDSQLLLDEKACCAMDARLQYSAWSAGDSVLPIVTVRSIAALSTSYQRMLGLEGLSGRIDLIGGGVSRLWSIAYTTAGEDRGASLSPLIQAAIKDAVTRDGHALALSVGGADLPMFREIDGIRALVSAAPSHFVLDPHEATSIDEFVQSRPKDVRKVWRRDLRDSIRLGLSFDVEALSRDGCARAASAVADTLALNGGDGSRELAEWRLASYLRRPGTQLLGVVSGAGESSFLGMTVLGGVLDVHTFGMLSHARARREHYQFMFRACLQFALDHNIADVRFGLEHSWPKLVRGCTEVRRWRVLYSARNAARGIVRGVSE